MYGIIGKILRINLSKENFDEVPTAVYAEKYLGGRGIATKIYWNEVKPEVGAFDPENKIVFMTGLLVGTGVIAANRLSIVGKSPMTVPEGFCYGNLGGFFGAALKRAGYDGIIIEGCAKFPLYVLIEDGKAEFRDAEPLWGLGAIRTGEYIKKFHGENAYFATTGPAGENRVRTAIIYASHNSTCTGGFGAVMGSKKIKAIVVSGKKKPEVFNLKKIRELNRYMVSISKRLRLAIPPLTRMTGKGHLLEVLGKGNCYQCGLECIRNVYSYGEALKANRRCQAMEYYLPWLFGVEDEPINTLFDAPDLANDYSICTRELQSIITWLYRCYKNGALKEEDVKLPLSKIGRREFLEKLLHAITYKIGIGAVLAEGIVRAKTMVPEKARNLMNPKVASIGVYDSEPSRAFIVNSLLYFLEPRVQRPLLHQVGFVMAAWAMEREIPNSTGVTNEVFRKISKVFWGSESAGEVSSYENKALAAKLIQNRVYLLDILGLCDFGWPVHYSLSKPDRVGDPELEKKMFEAVTGEKGDMLDIYAERLATLQRQILLREGRVTPQKDFPPEYNFKEPLDYDPEEMEQFLLPDFSVPGSGDRILNVKGNKLDREKFVAMLKEYYTLRGWDKDTGVPLKETLEKLEI